MIVATWTDRSGLCWSRAVGPGEATGRPWKDHRRALAEVLADAVAPEPGVVTGSALVTGAESNDTNAQPGWAGKAFVIGRHWAGGGLSAKICSPIPAADC